MREPTRRIETLAVTAGEHPTPETGPGDVVSPIHLASTYALPGLDTRLRERFAQVVHAGMQRAAEAMRRGQQEGRMRQDVDAAQIGTLLAALVIGAGTLTEMGVPYEVHAAADVVIRLLRA